MFDAALARLDEAISLMAEAPEETKLLNIRAVLDTAREVLMQEGGCEAVEQRASALDEAGVFLGTDWGAPHTLVPSFTRQTFQSPNVDTLVLEALSELRLLAVARSDFVHDHISAVQAHHFLTQVLALNLALMFQGVDEARRTTQGSAAAIPNLLLHHLATRIGYEHIIDSLIEEIWRILKQRPIQVDPVKQMIT